MPRTSTITLASTWRTSTVWMARIVPPLMIVTSSAIYSWEERHLYSHRILRSRHQSPLCALHDRRGLLPVCPTPRAMCTHNRGLRDSDVAGVVRCVHMYVIMSLCFI